MTGKRLLKQILHWDFEDFKPSDWSKKQNSASKKWSRIARRYLKKDLNKELNRI